MGFQEGEASAGILSTFSWGAGLASDQARLTPDTSEEMQVMLLGRLWGGQGSVCVCSTRRKTLLGMVEPI